MASEIIRKTQNGWALIWQNENPSTSFLGQTISVDLSQYNLIMVLAHSDTGPTMVSPLILTKESGGILIYEFMNTSSGSASILFRRLITEVTDSGITFGDGQSKPMNATSGATTNNSICIPYQIYAQ